MALSPPFEPQKGDEVLPWAQAVSRYLRWITPRESADIWPECGPGGTKYTQRRRRVGEGAAGASAIRFFQLLDATERDDEGEVTARKVRVVASTLAGGSSFGGGENLTFAEGDDPPYLLTVSGSGVIYGYVTVNVTTGAVTSRSVVQGATMPASSEEGGEYYVEIGTFNVPAGDADPISVNNSRYGPITADIFRDWFIAEVRFILAWV